ncbi:hypothetical protein V5P93_002947 [Actinokineospora auranticolor]|nr:hypothetical protein [Actinokineospora auranticolor]
MVAVLGAVLLLFHVLAPVAVPTVGVVAGVAFVGEFVQQFRRRRVTP